MNLTTFLMMRNLLLNAAVWMDLLATQISFVTRVVVNLLIVYPMVYMVHDTLFQVLNLVRLINTLGRGLHRHLADLWWYVVYLIHTWTPSRWSIRILTIIEERGNFFKGDPTTVKKKLLLEINLRNAIVEQVQLKRQTPLLKNQKHYLREILNNFIESLRKNRDAYKFLAREKVKLQRILFRSQSGWDDIIPPRQRGEPPRSNWSVSSQESSESEQSDDLLEALEYSECNGHINFNSPEVIAEEAEYRAHFRDIYYERSVEIIMHRVVQVLSVEQGNAFVDGWCIDEDDDEFFARIFSVNYPLAISMLMRISSDLDDMEANSETLFPYSTFDSYLHDYRIFNCGEIFRIIAIVIKRREDELLLTEPQLRIDVNVFDILKKNIMEYAMNQAWDETAIARDYIANLVEASLMLVVSLTSAASKQDVIMAILYFVKSMCKRSITLTIIESTILPDILPFIYGLFPPSMQVRAQSDFESGDVIGEYIRDARKVVTDYKAVKDSRMTSKLHELMAYMMAFVFCDKIDVEADNCTLKALSKKAVSIGKKKDYESFLFVLMDTLTFICDRGYAMIKNKSLMSLFDENRDIKNFMHEANKLIDDYAKLLNPTAHSFDEHKYQSDLIKCIEQGDLILKLSRDRHSDDKTTYAPISSLVSKLRMTNLAYINVMAAQSDRMAPFGICVSGGSSIGKSTFSTLLYYHFGRVRGKPIESIYRFFRNPDDEYWSGFMSFMWCIHIDDAANKKVAFCSEGDKSVSEILAISNQTPLNPNQADLEKKGKTPVRAELLTVSTNLYDLNICEYYETALAAQRRFNFTIHLEVKEKYAKHCQFLDSSKISIEDLAEDSFPDFWDIYVFEVVPVPGPILKQRGCYVPLATFKGEGAMKQFLKFYSERIMIHCANQEKTLKSLKKFSDVSYCESCKNPVGQCVCGDDNSPTPCEVTEIGSLVRQQMDTLITGLNIYKRYTTLSSPMNWSRDDIGNLKWKYDFKDTSLERPSKEYRVYIQFGPSGIKEMYKADLKESLYFEFDERYSNLFCKLQDFFFERNQCSFGDLYDLFLDEYTCHDFQHMFETIMFQLKYKLLQPLKAQEKNVTIVCDLPFNFTCDEDITYVYIMPTISNIGMMNQLKDNAYVAKKALIKYFCLEKFEDISLINFSADYVMCEQDLKGLWCFAMKHLTRWKSAKVPFIVDMCGIKEPISKIEVLNFLYLEEKRYEIKFNSSWLGKLMLKRNEYLVEDSFKNNVMLMGCSVIMMLSGYSETKSMQVKRMKATLIETHNTLYKSYYNFVGKQPLFVRNALIAIPYIMAAGTAGLGVAYIYNSIKAKRDKEEENIVPNYASGPRYECENAVTPVGNDVVNNPWYNNDFVLTPYDLPHSVAMSKCTSTELTRKFENNVKLVYFKCQVDGEIKTGRAHILLIGNHIGAINKHSLLSFPIEIVFNGDERLVKGGILGVTNMVSKTYQRDDVVLRKGSDIAYIKVDCLPACKDIRKYLPKTKDFSVVANGIMLSRDLKNGSVHYRDLQNVRKETRHYRTIDHNGDVWTVPYSEETISGQSGSAVILQTDFGPAVVGIHALIDMRDKTISSAALYLEDFVEAKKILSPILRPVQDNSLSIINHVGKKVEDLSSKSVLRYLPEGQCCVYGTVVPNAMSSGKSRVKETLLAPSMKQRGFTTEFAQPQLSDWRPWRKNMEKQLTIEHKIPTSVSNRIVKSLVKHISSGLSDEAKSELKNTLTLRSAINGGPGVRFIDGINRSTSTGFPHNTTKKKFLVSEPDELFPDGVEVTTEILSEVEKIQDCYDAGKRYKPIFTDSIKDEPRKVKKIEEGNNRVFSAAPLAFSLKVRQLFLPFVRILQSNKFLFMSAPGTNVHSKEWENIYKFLTTFGLKQLFDGDYGTFDKTMCCEIIRDAFAIIIGICEEAGASEQQLTQMSCAAEDICCAIKNSKGDLYEAFGGNPSGHPLTVIINCLANIIYLMFAYYRQYPEDRDFTNFFKYVHPMTYGDDNIVNVHESLSKFNFENVAKAMKEIGVIYTPADKGVGTYTFKSIYECSFLKRKWRYDEDLKVHLAPLEEESIIKSLMIGIKSTSVTKEEHAISIVQSAYLEYFQYGKKVLEDKLVFLRDLLLENNLTERSGMFPSWEECCARYIDASKNAEEYQHGVNHRPLTSQEQKE